MNIVLCVTMALFDGMGVNPYAIVQCSTIFVIRSNLRYYHVALLTA